MSSSAGAGGLEVRLDPAEFRRLFEKSSRVDKVLKAALRKNIRAVAGTAADAVRAEAMAPGGTSAASNSRSTGLRAGIAAGIQVKVMTGARAGVTIVASSSSMPAGEGSLVRAWEIGSGSASGWRHPVFGHGWTTQTGHPYFRKPIFDRRDMVRITVEQAMQTALDSLKD